MSNWPITQGVLGASTVTAPVTVNPNTAQHTDGPWTEILAAGANGGGEGLFVSIVGGDNCRAAFTFAFGASGSEVALSTAPVLLFDTVTTRHQGQGVLLPLHIPSGVRISARARAHFGGAFGNAVACAVLSSSPLMPVGTSRMALVGFVSGTTNGTSVMSAVAPGGAIVELTASTPFRARAFCVTASNVTSVSNFAGDNVLLRLYVGAAAAEIPISAGQVFYAETQFGQEVMAGLHKITLPCDIPAGTRLSARLIAGRDDLNVKISVTLFG